MKLFHFLPALALANAATAQTLPVAVVDTCPTVHEAATGTYTKTTVLYETTADGQTEYLDLYKPVGAVNPPMAMVVHGGGFVAGDKAIGNALPLSLELVSLGWEVASINYRLSGANGFANLFPAPLQDSLCALQWLKTNGGGDTGHVIVAGISAGGGIVNWIGTVAQTPNPAWESPTCSYAQDTAKVAGVATFYGFSDFATLADYSSVKNMNMWDLRVFGGTIPTQQAAIVAGSPINNISSSGPAFYVADGLADTVILPVQTSAFGAALTQAGVPTNVVQEAGVGHSFGPLNSSLGPIPCTFVAWLNAIRAL